MALPSSGGLMAAIMTGGPLPLPSLDCALCLAIASNDTGNHGKLSEIASPFVNAAKTLAAGWLVCEFHAEVLAWQLARTVGPRGVQNGLTGEMLTPAPSLADSFALPPDVMG